MSLRPVDMQLIVPKTIDYANKQQGELQKHSNDQQMYQQVATKQTEHRQTAVVHANESKEMNNSVNKDGHNKQQQKGNKKRKKTDDKQEEKNIETGTGLFDMKI